VKYMLPSPATVIARGPAPVGYSVIVPEGVTRAILFARVSVTHEFPSGPATRPAAPVAFGNGNVVISPDVVIRPAFPKASLNQSAPSGPTAICTETQPTHPGTELRKALDGVLVIRLWFMETWFEGPPDMWEWAAQKLLERVRSCNQAELANHAYG